MLFDIIKTYDNVANKINVNGIIHSGELFQSCFRMVFRIFIEIHSLRRLDLADMLWDFYGIISFASEVMENKFCDLNETVSNDEIDIVKKCIGQFYIFF